MWRPVSASTNANAAVAISRRELEYESLHCYEHSYMFPAQIITLTRNPMMIEKTYPFKLQAY